MLQMEGMIDADCHVMEPGDLWQKYIEPRYRDRAPRPPVVPLPRSAGAKGASPAEQAVELTSSVLLEGEEITHRFSPELEVRAAVSWFTHYGEPLKSRFDAPSHVAALRKIGFSQAYLYPTVGLLLFAIDTMDPELAGALVRAYNDWLVDFCGHDPSMLRGVGVVNQHDPADMLRELRRIHGFGWRAVVLRPNPIKGRLLSHPDFEPFWAECERLDIAVGLHEGTHVRAPSAGGDRFHTHFAMHACSHPIEQMMALLALVEGGVLERHPGLRVGFLESGCGWVPYWLFRLDEEHRQNGWEVKKNVRIPPSEYFRRQCFVGCEPGEPYLDRIIDFIGEDCVIFGSDYPHFDHTQGALGELLETNTKLGKERMEKILWHNPRRFYGATAAPAAAGGLS